jgi:hypothetical protein
VQRFTQAIFDQRSALAAVYAAAAQSDARSAGTNTFLPFHPGALRVYDALGAGAAARLKAALRRRRHRPSLAAGDERRSCNRRKNSIAVATRQRASLPVRAGKLRAYRRMLASPAHTADQNG